MTLSENDFCLLENLDPIDMISHRNTKEDQPDERSKRIDSS